MKAKQLELYTDYLIARRGQTTATGLAAVLEDEISHAQVTRFLSEGDSTSEDLWLGVKGTVREIEQDEACVLFDDTIQEKAWTDESEMICWHFDHCAGRSVKGINLLNALYYSQDVSIPVAFEIVKKPFHFLKCRHAE